jgi:hypothetical protein
MKAHDWFIEHRIDFVARALEPADETLFRDHLARCTECASAVNALTDELRWLPLGVEPVAPRPGFARRVVNEVAGPRPAAWRRWGWPVAAAAMLGCIVLGGMLGDRERELTALRISHDSIITAHYTDLAAVRDTLSVLRSADRILQASIEMNGRRGGMLIFADETSHRWKVVVHGIPRAPTGERYTFWFITADGMVHGAVLDCDERTPGIVTLDMPPGARLIRGGSLTVEPMDGDASLPRGPELAHLEL